MTAFDSRRTCNSRQCLKLRIGTVLPVPVLLLAATVGCEQSPEIVERIVPKPPSSSTPSLAASGMPQQSELKAAERRILAAIVPLAGKGWFFKVDGRRARVLAEIPRFISLLKSLKVEGEAFSWSTPHGWKELGKSGMREETFRIDDGVECSVIALGADDPSTTEYLLSNINRWRGQVKLPPLLVGQFESELDEPDSGDVQQFKLEDDRLVTWINVAGEETADDSDDTGGVSPESASSQDPDGGSDENKATGKGDSTRNADSTEKKTIGPAGPPGAEKPAVQTRTAAIKGMTFEVPLTWKQGRMAVMRQIAWQVGDARSNLEIYISKLPAEGSEVGPNVNRWRRQVGLDSLPDDGLTNGVDEMTIGGIKGSFVNLRGTDQTILGAIVVRGDDGFFFKAVGDPLLARQELDNFRAFLKSVKFK